MRSILLAPLGAFVLAGTALAQTSDPADLHWNLFQGRHGEDWQLVHDTLGGFPRMLFGGTLASPVRPRVGADYVRVARSHVRAASELFGVDVDDLVLDRELFLPLALVGSSDKVSVRFLQRPRGLEVLDGALDVLLDLDGGLLSIFSNTVALDEAFVSTPEVAESTAIEFAWSTFQTEEGGTPSYVEPARLVIVGAGPFRLPTLAWLVGVVVEESGIVTGGYRYTVAADADGARVLTRDAIVHQFDVGGQVFTNATPGLTPDSGSNQPAPQPMAFATVTSPQAGTTTTDADGFFNYAGVNGPINVTFGYEGSYNDVENFNGANHTTSQSLSGTGNVVTVNQAGTTEATAEANAFQWINTLGEWIRAVNPADTAANFIADCNANIPPGVVTNIDNCNAFWNGVSTNYFLAGSVGATSCANTAFSSIIVHEMGHWLNARYGSGNGSDGFGEGNADIFAMYLVDNAVVGQGFFTSGGGAIRTGNNTRQYCGDGNGGCYGQVHTDGEVLMGAFWKLRQSLKNGFGTTAGGDVADALFLAWMNAFDQSTIDSIIELQLLILDDDDANQSNGTPHQLQIGDGFRAQGFPGRNVAIANVTVLPDTLDEAGPYGVVAELVPIYSSGILAANLFYSVDGSFFLPTPMTNFGGDTWGATIPGIPSPARVSYYISATNNLGQANEFPASNESRLEFGIGEAVEYYFEDFEGGTDAGWTHGQIATQDDWQRGTPTGKNGTSQGITWSDPTGAFSGVNAWGNDLGPSGFNGSYQPDVENFLRSPVIDLSNAAGVQLEFQRWLTVEEGQFDQAQILVNGNLVWQNPANGALLDNAWTRFTLDVSSFADGNAAAQLEFKLISDGFLNLGGWNLDDVRLLSFAASPTTCLPVPYGSGLAGTNGVPTLDSQGQPARIGNGDFAIAIKNGRANAVALIGRGPLQANVPIFGGALLVAPAVIDTLQLNAFGQAAQSLPLPADPGLVGLTRHVQAFVLDPAAPAGVAMTAGLTVTLCN